VLCCAVLCCANVSDGGGDGDGSPGQALIYNELIHARLSGASKLRDKAEIAKRPASLLIYSTHLNAGH
jgi:hypothetical protein